MPTYFMPTYFVDEETLRGWASSENPDDEEDSGVLFDVEAEIARSKREPDGKLSEYKPAHCSLDEEKLGDIARLVLGAIRRNGVTHLVVDYNGGYDEGFTEFRAALTSNNTRNLEQLVKLLEDELSSEPPPPSPPQLNARYHFSDSPRWRTRFDETQFKLECLLDELACQLLGRGFGTGEGNMVGAFIADLQSNTLTDIAPEED